MLNIARRGPASVSGFVRSAISSSTRVALSRPPILSAPLRTTPKTLPSLRSFHASSQVRSLVATAPVESAPSITETPAESGSVTSFADLGRRGLVAQNVVDTITKQMNISTMTDVQVATISPALDGIDLVAQAKTGTGKTLGFLVPTVQNILKRNPELAERQRYSRARPSDIKAIIISPTRELAEQIAVEASKICSSTDLIVQVAVGGNSKRAMLQKVQREGCHILVATPGRLNDLLTDEYSRISAPGLTTLVLDEADRLLDQGFSRDIDAIIRLLPDRRTVDRQTFMFSATMPKEVMHLVRDTLKPDFQFIQTVKPGELATHQKVPQKVCITAGLENFMPSLLELAKRSIAAAADAERSGERSIPFKAIVYLQSTANVELSFQTFDNLRDPRGGQFGRHLLHPCEIMEIHGQLTQAQRTSVAERFRRAKSAILFSTDVTARGMDFPNVSHVVQFGLPSNRDQYIHRIGRTGRADKEGEAWLIIQAAEALNARKMLRGLPINKDSSLEAAVIDMTKDAQLPASLAATLTEAGEASKSVSRSIKAQAYTAALSQNRLGNHFVETLNRWTRFGWGMESPPEIHASVANKLRLSERDGVVVARGRGGFDDDDDRGFGGGSGRDFGDRRGGRGRGFGGARGFGGGGGRGFGGDRDRGFGRERGFEQERSPSW